MKAATRPRRRWFPNAVGVLFLGAGGLALGACGTHNAVKGTTTTTSAASTSSSSSSSTTSTSTPTTPACSAGVMQVSATPGTPAAGTSYAEVTVTNEGPTPCSLDGYPTVTLYGPSGASGAGAGPKLDLGAQHGGPAAAAVNLAPKGSAESLLVYSDVPVNGGGCSTVASIDVTLPGSSGAVSVPLSIDPCGASVTVHAFGPPGSESP